MLLAAADTVSDLRPHDAGVVEEKGKGRQMERMVWQCDISVDGLQQYACVGTVGSRVTRAGV